MMRYLHLVFFLAAIMIIPLSKAYSASPFDYIEASHSDLNISRVEMNGDIVQYTRLKNSPFNIYVSKQINNNNNNNNMRKNQTTASAESKKIGSSRTLIDDCRHVKINQMFLVNNCQKSIQIDVCAGSCPRGKHNLYEYCRMALSHSVRLDFDCPSISGISNLYITIKDADYCECNYDKSLIYSDV